MERIIDGKLIKRIRKIKKVENLKYDDFKFYTNNWQEEYAQCLIAQAISLEKQKELLKQIDNTWHYEHGYEDFGRWIIQDDAIEPQWLGKFHRIIEIEEEMLMEPEVFSEPDSDTTPTQADNIQKELFKNLMHENRVLQTCINKLQARIEKLTLEHDCQKNEQEELKQEETASCSLTARKCVALAKEFGAASKKMTQAEVNAFLACLTDKEPTSFHNYWSDTSSVQTKAETWAKEQKDKVLTKKK